MGTREKSFFFTQTLILHFLEKKSQNMEGVDPRQLQAMQQLMAQDPEIVKMQKMAEMKALIHEHANRCWERCKVGSQARNSSLSSSSKSCLNNCVRNWYTSQTCVNEYMEKKLGNK